MAKKSVRIGKRMITRLQRHLNEQYPELIDQDVTFSVESFRLDRHDDSIGIWTLVSEDEDQRLSVRVPVDKVEEALSGRVVNVLKSAAGPALFLLLIALLKKSSDVRICPVHSDVWSDADLFDMM